MEKTLEHHRNTLLSAPYNGDTKILEKIVDTLNSDGMVIITGPRGTQKRGAIAEIIKKTNVKNNTFYFNKEVSEPLKYNSSKEINELLSAQSDDIDTVKLVVLEEVNKVQGIKVFIEYLYKKGYKVVLIGNNIKIKNISEIEILEPFEKKDTPIIDVIQYGHKKELGDINNISTKKSFIEGYKDTILLKDIIEDFGVKNSQLLSDIFSLLSLRGEYISAREIKREMEAVEHNPSLRTILDYLDFSDLSKMISQVFCYDFKKKKLQSGKSQYFFYDNGVRNYFGNWDVSEKSLVRNLVFLKLKSLFEGDIHSGKNGTYDIDFFVENKVYKIIYSSSKTEIRRHIKWLDKIEGNFKKCIVVFDREKSEKYGEGEVVDGVRVVSLGGIIGE